MQVTLHLINGDRVEQTMTPHQRERISRTLNQNPLPTKPFVMEVGGACLDIPWRTIAYLSSKESA